MIGPHLFKTNKITLRSLHFSYNLYPVINKATVVSKFFVTLYFPTSWFKNNNNLLSNAHLAGKVLLENLSWIFQAPRLFKLRKFPFLWHDVNILHVPSAVGATFPSVPMGITSSLESGLNTEKWKKNVIHVKHQMSEREFLFKLNTALKFNWCTCSSPFSLYGWCSEENFQVLFKHATLPCKE